MPVTEADLHHLASSFLRAFDTLSAKDHLALRAPHCTHIFAPASLSIPPKSNNEFSTHLTNNLVPLLARFPVTPKEIHAHTTISGGQVTLWATGTPEFKKEVMDGEREGWEYTGEYIFILDVDEEGKIVRVVEFLDSKGTERLRGLVERARRNMGEGGKAW